MGYIAFIAKKSLINYNFEKLIRELNRLVMLRGRNPKVNHLVQEAITWATGPDQPQLDGPSSDMYFTQFQVWWK